MSREIAAGETSFEMDELAHKHVMGLVGGRCDRGTVPAYSSDARADMILMRKVIGDWEETRRAAFWESLKGLLVQNAGAPLSHASRYEPHLYLMTFYQPGDFTRAALRCVL